MTDEKEFQDVETEETVVEITDGDGNVTYFIQEMVVPVDNKNYAILVETKIAEDEDDQDTSEEEEEENVVVAKIEFDANGEETYVDPTDEEFKQFQAAYEKLMKEEDAE